MLFSLFSCQPPVNKLNAPNQDAGVNEPFTPGPSGGSPSSGDDGTLVLSLNSLEGTANAVGFSIVGVGSDVSSVKVFKDGICRIFAGHSVPVGGVASGRLNNLAVGVHNFYFVTERASGPSTCRSFSASYRRKPVAPISLSAAARGTDSTPPVMVWGGVQGDRVMLYGDSICSALLGSAVASGSSARVISRGLSVGQHRFYAKRERNGVASDCSMAYASYELQSSGTSVARANPPASQTSNTASTRHGTDFISVWRIARGGDSITLPLRKGSTVGMSLSYDFTVSWGDGTSSRVTSYDDPDKSHTYAQAGNYRVVISGTLEGWSFRHQYIQNGAQHLSSQQIISVPDLGDVGWKHLGGAFRDCANLERVIRGDVSGVVNMMNMFRDAPKVQVDVRGWDTSSVTNMSNMFANAAAAHPSMSTLDFSSVTTMQDMFNGVTLLTRDYSNFLLRVVATSTRNNVTLHGGGSRYNTAGQTARNTLVARGWSITDGGLEGATPPPTIPPTSAGICNRTAEVQSVLIPPTKNCSQVTAEDLRRKNFSIGLTRLTSLKEGDFAGLSNLRTLSIDSSQLSSLPARVFTGLSSLRSLSLGTLGSNQISILSYSNMLKSLSETTTRNNGTVSAIGLKYNASAAAARQSLIDRQWSITDGGLEGTTSPTSAGICNRTAEVQSVLIPLTKNCSQVTAEDLRRKNFSIGLTRLTSLKEGDFAGLSNLRTLSIDSSQLSSLPERVFTGLSSLRSLSLGTLGSNQISILSYSNMLKSLSETTTRNNGTVSAIGLKYNASAAAARQSLIDRQWSITDGGLEGTTSPPTTSPPTTSPPTTPPTFVRVCDRTARVQVAILRKVAKGSCSQVTAEDLRSINELDVWSLSPRPLTLKRGDFAGLSSLQKLKIAMTRLSSLPAGIFAGLSQLQELNLSRNNLTSLPEGIFAGLSSLQMIILDGNKLSSLPAGIFAGLSSLQNLRLGGNNISSFPTGMFTGLSSSLREVHLTGINITSVPRRLLSELSSLPLLGKLAFSGRYLSRLPKGMFAEFSSLKELYISGYGSSSLNHLEEGTFAGLSQLQKLNIGISAIRTLPEGVFAGLSQLQELAIADSYLTSLPAGIFAGLSQLQKLYLGGKKLTSLPAGIFAGLSQLQELKLYWTYNLSSLSAGIFAGLSQLQKLNLRGNNKLSSWSAGIFAGLSSLQKFEISYSSLSSLPAGIFAGLSQLQELDLRDNNLTSLPAGIFAGLSQLQELSLDANSKLTSLPAGIFAGLSQLQELSLDANSKLTSLPAGIFAGLSQLQKLNVSNSPLTSLPEEIFAGLSQLQELKLYWNSKLTSLPEGIFAGLSQLQKLNVSNSPLTSLPEEIFGRTLSIAGA